MEKRVDSAGIVNKQENRASSGRSAHPRPRSLDAVKSIRVHLQLSLHSARRVRARCLSEVAYTHAIAPSAPFFRHELLKGVRPNRLRVRAQVLLLRSRPRGTFYVKCVPFSGLQVVSRGGEENVILLGMALYNHGSRDLFKKKEEERERKRSKQIILSRHCFFKIDVKVE